MPEMQDCLAPISPMASTQVNAGAEHGRFWNNGWGAKWKLQPSPPRLLNGEHSFLLPYRVNSLSFGFSQGAKKGSRGYIQSEQYFRTVLLGSNISANMRVV